MGDRRAIDPQIPEPVGAPIHRQSSDPLLVTGLRALMSVSSGSADIVIGLVDGPVAADHPALVDAKLHALSEGAICSIAPHTYACAHGTAVAGLLASSADAPVNGICPDSPIVVSPIFSGDELELTASPRLVADAITKCVRAGARIINLSAAFDGALSTDAFDLSVAVDDAARHGVIVVVAAGNHRRVGGSPLISHPWVVPVTSCDLAGSPLASAMVGRSIGRNGLLAPGFGAHTLTPDGGYGTFSGTSAAAPLVTGALALAWAVAPGLSATEIRSLALGTRKRRTVVPPMLDANHIRTDLIPTKGGVIRT
jgi:subtilisin family serine protease